MEVRPDILKKLLCSVCGEYLSCAPVRMKTDGAALCGRCCDPEGELTLRITPYENLAEMLVFPCANKTHGCTETLYMIEMKDHEDECKYKQYVCPVTESGQCDWSGARKNILDHCQEQHPDKLLQDPYTITHQINETNHKTFLLTAFHMLFIVHCKVCIATKSIYHSVRFIGQSVLAAEYKYELEVTNDNGTLIRRREVAPQGCMSLQQDVSIDMDINTVLKFLGDIKDALFKITVSCKTTKCKNCVDKCLWPTDSGWRCEDCAPARRVCRFKKTGCTYVDTCLKVNKHERLFCEHSNQCDICRRDVTTRREQHYMTEHADVMYETGVTVRALVENTEKYLFLISDVGATFLFCFYILKRTRFTLGVCAPLNVQQISDYKCIVKLTNPVTGHTVRYSLNPSYTNMYDWVLHINTDVFSMYACDNCTIDIQIELVKK